MFLIGCGENLWRRFLPKYLQSLGAPIEAIGLFGTAEDFLYGVYQYPGGWIADRYGRRAALILFISLAALGYLVYLVLPAWPLAFVGRRSWRRGRAWPAQRCSQLWETRCRRKANDGLHRAVDPSPCSDRHSADNRGSRSRPMAFAAAYASGSRSRSAWRLRRSSSRRAFAFPSSKTNACHHAARVALVPDRAALAPRIGRLHPDVRRAGRRLPRALRDQRRRDQRAAFRDPRRNEASTTIIVKSSAEAGRAHGKKPFVTATFIAFALFPLAIVSARSFRLVGGGVRHRRFARARRAGAQSIDRRFRGAGVTRPRGGFVLPVSEPGDRARRVRRRACSGASIQRFRFMSPRRSAGLARCVRRNGERIATIQER